MIFGSRVLLSAALYEAAEMLSLPQNEYASFSASNSMAGLRLRGIIRTIVSQVSGMEGAHLLAHTPLD